jgi:hypothetical protein
MDSSKQETPRIPRINTDFKCYFESVLIREIHSIFLFSYSKILTAAGIIALLWMIGPISMPALAQSSLPEGVNIKAKAAPEIATIGDPIRIDLMVSMPAGCHLDVPKPESQIGDFTILEFFPGPATPDSEKSGKPSTPFQTQAGASQHHQAQIVASAYKTGILAFPSIRMKLHTADGKEIELSSPPVNVEIRSVLNDKNQNLIDLKKQAEIPGPWIWLAWGTIVAGVLILAAALWIGLKRRRKRPVSLSPVQAQNLIDLAEADLKNLLARGLPENGHEKQFYILLSEIVKRILEAGYGVHTAELTTSEIMSSLHKKTELESEKTELIESFLLRCDVVKFAKYLPSRIEHEAVSNDALQILKAVGSG